MLPMLLRVKIKSPDANFGLFLPLPIVYLLLLPAFAICGAVYAVLLAAGEQGREARQYLKLVFMAPRLLAAATGTEVIVRSDDTDVTIYIK